MQPIIWSSDESKSVNKNGGLTIKAIPQRLMRRFLTRDQVKFSFNRIAAINWDQIVLVNQIITDSDMAIFQNDINPIGV